MYLTLLFISLAALANSQNLFLNAPQPTNNDLSAPTPYQFSYSAPASGGGSSHEQTGDEYGRVTGSYTVSDEDGRQRIVNYVADELGFRASISTNEPGTSSQSPADVTINSSADDGSQALAAPSPAQINRPAPRISNQRVAPLQPAVIPFQPALVPIQPAQPTFIPFGNQGFQPNQPIIIPIGAVDTNRLFNPPLIGGFIPIQGGRQISQPQPTFIPITEGGFQPIR